MKADCFLMSKRAGYSVDEVELLRACARKLKDCRGLTGAELGRIMGIEQQNASAFTKPGASKGIDRNAANGLAAAMGLLDAEELLRELKSLRAAVEDGVSNVWHARDSARRIAEALGVSPEAIEMVFARRKTPADAQRPAKWWLLQFSLQEQEIAADKERHR